MNFFKAIKSHLHPSPVTPLGQSQRYEPCSLMHFAPATHGLLTHSSISIQPKRGSPVNPGRQTQRGGSCGLHSALIPQLNISHGPEKSISNQVYKKIKTVLKKIDTNSHILQLLIVLEIRPE